VIEPLAEALQPAPKLRKEADLQLFPQQGSVGKEDRRRQNTHHSFVVWMTGLSGAGKSTLSYCLELELFQRNMHVYVLDADMVRSGLNQSLGFSPADRTENIRRLAEVAKLMVDAGLVVIVAAITPYQQMREDVRGLFGEDEFVEVYVKCPIDLCRSRDVKGLYHQADQGYLPHMTGVSDVYEEPLRPDFVIDTEQKGAGESVRALMVYLEYVGIVAPIVQYS